MESKAYMLFDSGSTMDAVSPDFTQVVSLLVKQLDKPVTLQLGCLGSQSKVNKYDSILGTPFLWKHGIQLDFETQEIVIRGKLHISTLPEGGLCYSNHDEDKPSSWQMTTR